MFFNVLLILIIQISITYCSVGDRLPQYQNCYRNCLQINCTDDEAIEAFGDRQALHLRLLGWDCVEECKYQCQWQTVERLIRSGLPYRQLPQFYGKWLFIRIYGLQEPASVIFSILNLYSNYYAWKRYRRLVHYDRFAKVWTFYAILSMNAWFWSTVFHTHETFLTEKLDYFSAYSVVIYSMCALIICVLDNYLRRTIRLYVHIGIGMPFLAFFLYHIHYLFNVHFDYGYNMKVNIITGILSSFGWLLWSARNRHKGRHIWKCVFSIILLNSLLLLEILDFPPIGYFLDAHSLWHLSTVPLPLIWFSYLTDEALCEPDFHHLL